MLELVRDPFGEEAHQVGVDHNAIHVSAFAAEGRIMVPHRRQRVAGLETVHCLDLTSDHREEELWEQGIRLLADIRLEAGGVHPGIKILELAERGQHLRPWGGGVLLGESQSDRVGLEASLVNQGHPSLDSAGAALGGSRAGGFVLARNILVAFVQFGILALFTGGIGVVVRRGSLVRGGTQRGRGWRAVFKTEARVVTTMVDLVEMTWGILTVRVKQQEACRTRWRAQQENDRLAGNGAKGSGGPGSEWFGSGHLAVLPIAHRVMTLVTTSSLLLDLMSFDRSVFACDNLPNNTQLLQTSALDASPPLLSHSTDSPPK